MRKAARTAAFFSLLISYIILEITKGELAPGNAALVERAVNIITNMGYSVANPSEAREILNI